MRRPFATVGKSADFAISLGKSLRRDLSDNRRCHHPFRRFPPPGQAMRKPSRGPELQSVANKHRLIGRQLRRHHSTRVRVSGSARSCCDRDDRGGFAFDQVRQSQCVAQVCRARRSTASGWGDSTGMPRSNHLIFLNIHNWRARINEHPNWSKTIIFINTLF